MTGYGGVERNWKRHSLLNCWQFALVGSNPTSVTMRTKEYDLEKIKHQVFEEKLSYESIGKEYGVSGTAIKKFLVRRNIELPPRRVINENETFGKGLSKNPKAKCIECGKEFVTYASKLNKYCSCKCERIYLHREGYKKLILGDPSIMKASYIPRAFKQDILNEQDGVCAICGMKPEWNDKPLVFILDHIDGKASNNRRDNLRCICPNCDSQLDTYKSKNKNSDRTYYHFNHR